MPCLHLHLEEWRAAERQRARTMPRTGAWREADDAVRLARLRYQAETVRVRAHYQDLERFGPPGGPHRATRGAQATRTDLGVAIWSALIAALPAR